MAEFLADSPQAVSRWETDLSNPDISLLPPMANLFSVTTDYLLGIEDYQKNMRKAEYEEVFTDYWKHDDKEMNYEIACRAVAEYPGNMEWLEWMASDEYYLACVKEGELAYGLYEQAIRHYRIVWENADDCILRDKVLEGIVRSLTQKGDPKGATLVTVNAFVYAYFYKFIIKPYDYRRSIDGFQSHYHKVHSVTSQPFTLVCTDKSKKCIALLLSLSG